MRRASPIVALLCAAALLAAAVAPSARAQQIVDRIVVRIENDIITQSDLDELAAYQELVSARADSEDRLTEESIEQWIVNSEAQAAHFPTAPQMEVRGDIAEIEKKFASPDVYRARLAELGISEDDVQQMVARQTYLEHYLDSKFRDSVQIDAKQIQSYYDEQLVPALQNQGEAAPPLADVAEHIRELLTEQEINRLAGQWIDESKGRLRIEIIPAPGASPHANPAAASSGAPK